MTMWKIILSIALFSLIGAWKAHAQSHAFENGLWFDGTDFVPRTAYAVDGVFTEHPPKRLDATFDLQGGYVIPPFGEAHNHNLENSYRLAERINSYLIDGVFYAKMQSSIKRRVETNQPLFEGPASVDVTYAHAPLTATGGHPVALRERFFDMGRFQGLLDSKEAIKGEGYFIVDSKEDLDQVWPDLLAQSPDFVKINLLHSERYDDRRDDPAFFGRKGLNPDLVSDIVARAHEDGLRVSAHVETVTDFYYAVTGGVDEINHLPSRKPDGSALIPAADAKAAAEAGIVVVTTASLLENYTRKDDRRYPVVRAIMAANLRMLQDAGVTLAVGSDIFGDTSSQEALYLQDLDALTPLELLRAWAVNAPQTIFPDRKIGDLSPGHEASFLVLSGNPLEDFSHTQNIQMRYKQGVDLANYLPAMDDNPE